jgi:hypothetical protein
LPKIAIILLTKGEKMAISEADFNKLKAHVKKSILLSVKDDAKDAKESLRNFLKECLPDAKHASFKDFDLDQLVYSVANLISRYKDLATLLKIHLKNEAEVSRFIDAFWRNYEIKNQKSS